MIKHAGVDNSQLKVHQLKTGRSLAPALQDDVRAGPGKPNNVR